MPILMKFRIALQGWNKLGKFQLHKSFSNKNTHGVYRLGSNLLREVSDEPKDYLTGIRNSVEIQVIFYDQKLMCLV